MKDNLPKDRNQNVVMECLGLSQADISDIVTRVESGSIVVYITLERIQPACGRCGHLMVSNGYRERILNHKALTHTSCTVIINLPRWKCPICHKTHDQKTTFTGKRQRISMMTAQLILQDLRSPTATFTEVGKRYGLSSVAVSKIFDRYVQFPPETKLPRVLLMDEVYAFSSEDSNFVLVALDMESQLPVDVFPSRRKDILRNFYKSFPLSEREKVEYFCSDM